MNQQTANIVGIAAVSLAAIGLLAPAATASPAPGNLAPGLQCGPGPECQNNTNQTYRIDWTGTCTYSQAIVDPITVPEHTWIAPHEQIALSVGINDAYCPPETSSQESNFGAEDDGGIASAQFQGAVVDNSHPPAPGLPTTGSAG